MGKEKKSKYFFTIIFIVLISLFIYNIVFIQPDFSKNKIWVIAEPYGIEGGGKGGSPYIKFKYRFRNKVYKKKKNGIKSNFDTLLNNRYLIEISSTKPNVFRFSDKLPVPDSIKYAPPNGWKELPEWAKQ